MDMKDMVDSFVEKGCDDFAIFEAALNEKLKDPAYNYRLIDMAYELYKCQCRISHLSERMAQVLERLSDIEGE